MNLCPAGMSILIYLLGKDKYKISKIYQPGWGVEASGKFQTRQA
jgi:hypothetical protein